MHVTTAICGQGPSSKAAWDSLGWARGGPPGGTSFWTAAYSPGPGAVLENPFGDLCCVLPVRTVMSLSPWTHGPGLLEGGPGWDLSSVWPGMPPPLPLPTLKAVVTLTSGKLTQARLSPHFCGAGAKPHCHHLLCPCGLEFRQ